MARLPADNPGRDEPLALSLRGLGPVGLLAMAAILLSGNVFVGDVVVPVGAMLALLWVKVSGTPWSAIGYVRPRHLWRVLAMGVALGVLLKLLMKSVVMPLLGADPVNAAYHHLQGNQALLPFAIWAMLVAGFAEETVFRGYLFERLGRLLGGNGPARVAIVVVSSLVFGLGHYAVQGLPGAQQATLFGLLFGAIYLRFGQLWLLVIAHAAFDLTALAVIYFGLETQVAHWVF